MDDDRYETTVKKKVPQGTPLHLAIRYVEMQLYWEIHVLWPLGKFTTLQRQKKLPKPKWRLLRKVKVNITKPPYDVMTSKNKLSQTKVTYRETTPIPIHVQGLL